MRGWQWALLIASLPLPVAAETVTFGRDPGGAPVCVTREQGDSHRLEIGVSASGAFVRLSEAEQRPAAPPLEVRAYAGKRIGQGREERFSQLTSVAGVRFAYAAQRDGGFLLTAAGGPDLLLAIVAEAKREFLVLETFEGRVQDHVAVYAFDLPTARALLACKRQNGL